MSNIKLIKSLCDKNKVASIDTPDEIWEELGNLVDLYNADDVKFIVGSWVYDEGDMNNRLVWVRYPKLGKEALDLAKVRLRRLTFEEGHRVFFKAFENKRGPRSLSTKAVFGLDK